MQDAGLGGENVDGSEDWGRRSTTRSLRSIPGAGQGVVIPGLKSVTELLEGEGGGDDAFLMIMAAGANIGNQEQFRTRSAHTESLVSSGAFARQALLPIAKSERNGFSHMITLGRSENNDLILPFGQVSKLHAYFSRDDRGWSLRDCGSANGTKLNGQRLEPKDSVLLRSGCELIFGRVLAVQFLTRERLREYSEFLSRLDPREAS